MGCLPPHAFETSKVRRAVTNTPAPLLASSMNAAPSRDILKVVSLAWTSPSVLPAEYHLNTCSTPSSASATNPSSDIENPAVTLLIVSLAP